MTDNLFVINIVKSEYFINNFSISNYCVLLFDGEGSFSLDFVEYNFIGKTVLFTSPYQNLKWLSNTNLDVHLLIFHGDFYCIEYHKKEVACNGLLFNNIYLQPHINLHKNIFDELLQIMDKMQRESDVCEPYSQSVLKTYLQLILALCSKEKSKIIENEDFKSSNIYMQIAEIQNIVEKYYITERSPSFYATALSMATNSFSKKIKLLFNKTPSQIIQERVVLEAKKMLHLSYKSVKEIAFELNFEDEFYFSRYFKKSVGLSPIHFREKVGISIVAQKENNL